MKKTAKLSLMFFLCLGVFKLNLLYAYDVAIHGFVAQGFLKTNENNYLAKTEEGSFEFNELGINFTTGLADRLRLGMQFFARDLGDLGNDKITVDWAYADYLYKEWLGLRVGKMKIPFGFYNESRDADMLRTSIFLPHSVYNEANRDSFISAKGAGLYGDFLGHIAYQFQIAKLDAPLDGGLAKSYRGVAEIDSTSGTAAIIGNLQYYDIIDGLKIGGTFMNWEFGLETTATETIDLGAGPMTIEIPTTVDGEATVWTAGVEYIWSNLIVAGEYVKFSWDLPATMTFPDIIPDVALAMMGVTRVYTEPQEYNPAGYYARISYRFTDWFELGTYYSVYYTDPDDPDGEEYTNENPGYPAYHRFMKDIALSTRFDINANWTIKLEGHIVNGTAGCYSVDNINDAGALELEEDWMLLAAKVMFNF